MPHGPLLDMWRKIPGCTVLQQLGVICKFYCGEILLMVQKSGEKTIWDAIFPLVNNGILSINLNW